MHDNRVSNWRSDTRDKAVETIDDLVSKTEELLAALKKLSQTRHPLLIRRGVGKEVGSMTDNQDSMQIKAGSKTYFFDIKTTRDGRPYLVITESRFKGEHGERERNQIIIFQESAQEFVRVLSTMAAKLR